MLRLLGLLRHRHKETHGTLLDAHTKLCGPYLAGAKHHKSQTSPLDVMLMFKLLLNMSDLHI